MSETNADAGGVHGLTFGGGGGGGGGRVKHTDDEVRSYQRGTPYESLRNSDAEIHDANYALEEQQMEEQGIWFYDAEFSDPNIHTWCIVHATNTRQSICSRLGSTFLSAAVILAQILILSLMIREADGARCQGPPGGDNGGPQGFGGGQGCPDGTFCAGSKPGPENSSPGYAEAPGLCTDCYFATVDTSWMKANQPDGLSAAVAVCNATNSHGQNCMYIRESYTKASRGTLPIIVFVSLLVALPIIQDADEVATDKKVLLQTGHALPSVRYSSALCAPRARNTQLSVAIARMYENR